MQNDQTELVAQTVVTMNGVQIINSTNFNSSVAELDIPVTLQATNTLTVELRGKPGGVLTIEVIGVDNDPPTIKATPSPLPNAAGWNNTTVTVTFTCNDATSGVASCPASQTVSTEGSKVISGTATDNAGNTANASITVNIDETAPTITATAAPAANSNGWNNSNVTVTFSCADSLSGVANCTSPATVSTEAANQVIPGAATDVAGNSASASATINLDKTPPTISITSPTSGATLTASSVSVTGNVSDSLSGVSSVTCNGTAATIQSGIFTCSVNLAFGSNTITAQAIDLAGNLASASVNVFRNNPPSIASLSPASGPVGTSVTLAGSYFGSAQGTSTITFNGVSANPTSWSDSQIIVPAPSGSSTGNVIVTVAGLTSNAQLFTVVTAPIVNSLSPTSGPVGTSVTISGVHFGAPQGTSTVTFNGTLANATSWSDTQIIVPVPSGASTGPVVVTVAGQPSNSPTFGVGTPPTIAASASPAPNASGWNNTNVTVTFTCTSGSSPVASCPGPQIITSEGANQPVSGTATDTDGTTATKTVLLNIDKTRPVLVISSPTDGSTVSSSAQVVAGTASDPLSGPSSVTCNGRAAPLSSGSFSCNISLNVGVNLIVVRATDVAGNVAGSNFHVTLPGTLPAPQSLTVTPVTANLVVGQTQQLTAVDELGRPRPDATWTVSNPAIATISNDPTLTVIGTGQFTLTATVGGIATQSTWNAASGPSLSPGTIQWSAPITPGSNVTQIIQAEPVTGGPDLFSVEMNPSTGDTTIRALTSDGEQLWAQPFAGTYASATADGNGGLIINYHNYGASNGSYALVDLDAQTGAKIWENDSVFLAGFQPRTTLFSFSQAVAPDGTILLAGDFNYAFDTNTGAATIQPPPPNAPQGSLTWWDFCGGPVHTVPYPFTTQQSGPYDSVVIGPSIAADGTIFQVVSSLDLAFTPSPCSDLLSSVKMTLYLSQTAPDGSVTFTPFHTETSLIPDSYPFPRSVTVPQCYPRCTEVGEIPPNQQLPTDITFRVIPDGQGGALVPWWKDLGYYTTFEAHVTHISASGVSDVVLPLTYQNTAIQNSNVCPFNPGQLPCIADFRMVLGENGVAFATDLKSVVAFNTSSLTPLWTYTSASGMDLVAATADGGVTINDAQQGLIPLDANGAPGTPTGSPFNMPSYSWSGSWAAPSPSSGATSGFALPIAVDFASLWAEPDGNPSEVHAAGRPWYFILNWQNAFDFIPDNPSILPNLKTDITNDATQIKTAALNALKQAYKQWPVVVAEGTPGTGDHQAVVQTTSTNQGQSCGSTNINVALPVDSEVWYECNMEEAQVALQVVINNAQDESTALARQDLIQAIGRGIGNNAAHEIAHQFLIKCCSMDVTTSQDPNSAATYNNGDADGDPSPQVVDSDPAPYTGYGKDGKTPIHWESTTQNALAKCLGKGYTKYANACVVQLHLSRNEFTAGSPSGILAKALLSKKPISPPSTKRLTILPFLADLAIRRP
jgi:hypothetical protein